MPPPGSRRPGRHGGRCSDWCVAGLRVPPGVLPRGAHQTEWGPPAWGEWVPRVFTPHSSACTRTRETDLVPPETPLCGQESPAPWLGLKAGSGPDHTPAPGTGLGDWARVQCPLYVRAPARLARAQGFPLLVRGLMASSDLLFQRPCGVTADHLAQCLEGAVGFGGTWKPSLHVWGLPSAQSCITDPMADCITDPTADHIQTPRPTV